MRTGVPSSLSNAYNPATLTLTIMYGPSQFGWNLSAAGSTVFSNNFLKARSPARNASGFTCLLYKFVIICLYDAIRTSSFAISKSLEVALVLAFLGIL